MKKRVSLTLEESTLLNVDKICSREERNRSNAVNNILNKFFNKNFIKNEKAVSFGYLVIAAFLILGTAIWVMFAPVFNNFFTPYNQDIADGKITVQNQHAMQFHKNVIYVVPIVMLIGLAGWGFIRALENRNQP